VAAPGDYGKPRPSIVLQSDLFNDAHPSVTIAPITTALLDAPLFRLTIEPSGDNGLRSLSQVMIDKVTTVRKERTGEVIGFVDGDTLVQVNRALALWLGIAAG
jgi:mRNA interferase MazF